MDIKLGQFLWKDADSNVGNCSSLSEAEGPTGPGYVVNGIPLDDATRRTIPHAAEAGEGAVWVPANVIDRIKGRS